MPEKIGYSPSPHPSQGDKYTLTVDGTAGTFVLAVKTAATGPAGGATTTNVAAQNHNVAAATLQGVLEAMTGLDGVTVTGGPGGSGGSNPYLIEVASSYGQLVLVSEAVTGGGGTVVLQQTQYGPVRQPAPAGAGVPTTRSVTTDKLYGSPAATANPQGASAVASQVSAAQSANQTNTDTEPSAKHLGYTPDKTKWPPANQ